jgi:hypothetical protein
MKFLRGIRESPEGFLGLSVDKANIRLVGPIGRIRNDLNFVLILSQTWLAIMDTHSVGGYFS